MVMDVFSEGIKVIITGVSYEGHTGVRLDITEELGQKYHSWGSVG